MHDGRIKKGMKLPSKRQLAKKLLISQTTIERAYDQLLAEGYILSKPKRAFCRL
jgi:GntR family transcriptional regulator/MocR family aminotransferase